MRSLKQFIMGLAVAVVTAVSAPVFALDYIHSTPGAGGYDVVAYFTDGQAMRGSGYHVADYDGVTYAFTSESHKKLFVADPMKYLPAYGGYCAYGVSVAKKFVADPEVWKIVDDTLYLNLDKGIQAKWEKDIPGNIKKAEMNWLAIKDKAPGDL